MERLAQGYLGSSDKWCNFSCFNLGKFYHWFQKKEPWATRKQFGLAIFNFVWDQARSFCLLCGAMIRFAQRFSFKT